MKLEEDNKRIEEAVRDAEHFFWEEICVHFPEVRTGDLDPGTVFALNIAMENAVRIWLGYNAPDNSNTTEVR